MWTVLQEKNVEKQLNGAPHQVQARFEKWKDIVQAQGPAGLRLIKGFKDHALKGQWEGARSSYLNDKWRVIYVAHASQVKVLIMEVTPHDYRKKS